MKRLFLNITISLRTGIPSFRQSAGGFNCPAGVQKTLGTNHAVMMGADVIQEPFAVINCDDFYGRDSFQVMGKFLSAPPEGAKTRMLWWALVEIH